MDDKPWKVRPLTYSDLHNGFLTNINEFSTCKELINDPPRLIEVYSAIMDQDNEIFVVVNDEDEVLGTATLFWTQRFSNNGRVKAFINDVVVRADHRRKGIGAALVNQCLVAAKDWGAVQVTLTSGDNNLKFYEGLGFRAIHNHMVRAI